MIDYRRLREMEADFGAEELDAVIATFLMEARTAIAALRSGWWDLALRRDRLHFLKGCALTIGARRLAEYCQRLEAEPHPGADEIRRLDQEFTALRDALARERLREPS